MPKSNATVRDSKIAPGVEATTSFSLDREGISSVLKGKDTEKEKDAATVERQRYNEYFFKVPSLVWWILCIGGMVITGIIAYSESTVHHLLPLDVFAVWLFGSRERVKLVFHLALGAHVIEAQYAVYVCITQLRLNSWPFWAIQTFLLGWPSLSLLLSRRDELETIYASRQMESKAK
jgi:hypothetical protein